MSQRNSSMIFYYFHTLEILLLFIESSFEFRNLMKFDFSVFIYKYNYLRLINKNNSEMANPAPAHLTLISQFYSNMKFNI